MIVPCCEAIVVLMNFFTDNLILKTWISSPVILFWKLCYSDHRIMIVDLEFEYNVTVIIGLMRTCLRGLEGAVYSSEMLFKNVFPLTNILPI